MEKTCDRCQGELYEEFTCGICSNEFCVDCESVHYKNICEECGEEQQTMTATENSFNQHARMFKG